MIRKFDVFTFHNIWYVQLFQWICHATCWTTGKFSKQVLVLSQNLLCYIYCLWKLTSKLFKCLQFHCVAQHHYKPSYEGKQCSYTYVDTWNTYCQKNTNLMYPIMSIESFLGLEVSSSSSSSSSLFNKFLLVWCLLPTNYNYTVRWW